MPKPKKNESKQDFLSRCTSEVMGEGKDRDQAYAMCNAFWDESHHAERDVLAFAAPFEFKKAEKENGKPSFMITAYTGKPVDTWFGPLAFDVSGMKAKAKIPALREHKRDRVVGWTTKSWNDGRRFYLDGEFSENTPDGKEVLALAQEGFPWQASVGIWPQRIEVLEKGVKAQVNGESIEGPAEIWRESLVGEISFVALGRDDNTAAIVLSESGQKVPVVIERQPLTKEVTAMTLEELKTQHPELFKAAFDLGVASVDLKKLAEDATTAERKRVTDIMAVNGDADATAKAITEGLSADASYKLFFEAEKAKKTKGLQELEDQAAESVGARQPQDPDPNKGKAQAELMAKAKKLAQEKKITVHQALRELQAEDPKTLSESLPRMHVVVND